MELLQLEYFRKVAELESITKAANALHISQPSLSISIKKLESELNTKLFDRISGKIRLNSIGFAFLKKVDRIFLDIGEARLEIDETLHPVQREIKIAGSVMGICTQLFKDYMSEHPDQPVRYYVNDKLKIRNDLELGELDFAICASPIVAPRLLWKPLLDEKAVLLVSHSHRFAGRKFVNIRELKDENFIIQRSAYDLDIEHSRVFIDNGISYKSSFSTNEMELAFNMVDVNIGVMLTSFFTAQRMLRNHPQEAVAIPIKPLTTVYNIGAVHLDGHYFTKSVQDFYDYTSNFYSRLAEMQKEILEGP